MSASGIRNGAALGALLPEILPLAVTWAEQQAENILKNGRPLSESERKIAIAVGVRRPELVRIMSVAAIPTPNNPALRAAAAAVGLLGSNTAGITCGYGIYIREGQYGERLVVHECRHVYQYEQYGSISAFLLEYLSQLIQHGYFEAPLELDARIYESQCAH